MYLFEDSLFYKNKKISIIGWTGPEDRTHRIEFNVRKGGRDVPFQVTFAPRPDVSYALYKDPRVGKPGFFLQIESGGGAAYEVVAREMDGDRETDRRSFIVSRQMISVRNAVRKTRAFYRETRKTLRHYIRSDYRHYTDWFQMVRANSSELAAQREHSFSYEPLISILTPCYHTPSHFLHCMIQSVLNQTYGRFELVIANTSPEDSKMTEILEYYAGLDSRIRLVTMENQGISANTNALFNVSSGEYIALVDHDDMIEPDALYEFVKKLNEDPAADLLYSDEDKIRENSDYFYYPNFKPDFNIDMLFNNNYICHLLMVRRSMILKVGRWDPEMDGAQDYDLILKVVSEGGKIAHIRRVLYHWRSCGNSTARNAGTKNYTIEASVKAIDRCYARMNIPAAAHPAGVAGWYVSEYTLQNQPLVSVLIPNKDHTDDLDVCVRSLEEKCTYKNLEIIVIENNSTDDKTFSYYKELEKRYANVQVIYYKDSFNYSRINNFGFRASHGEYVLLLNNDTEAISPNLFESMLGYAARADVGAVGVRLLYKDNTVQHAGVLAGAGGLADHYFKGLKRKKPGYMCRAVTTYDVYAATAACLMMKRKVYEEVGGLEENLAVAFNDVDLCMKISRAGYLIVYDAQAEMYHYESKSRGSENTPEKFIRFGEESLFINEKWQMLTAFEDPCYNPNMSYLNYFQPEESLSDRREQNLREYLIKKSEEDGI